MDELPDIVQFLIIICSPILAIGAAAAAVRPVSRWLGRTLSDGNSDSDSVAQRLTAIERQIQAVQQSVESVALEVERISEAQRYAARLEAERSKHALPEARPPRRTPGVITPH